MATSVLPQLLHFQVFSGRFTLFSAILFLLEVCREKYTTKTSPMVNNIFSGQRNILEIIPFFR